MGLYDPGMSTTEGNYIPFPDLSHFVVVNISLLNFQVTFTNRRKKSNFSQPKNTQG